MNEIQEDIKFEIDKELRQGDGLSTTTFDIVMERIMRASEIKDSLIEKSIQITAFADDIAMIARDERFLGEIIENIKKEA